MNKNKWFLNGGRGSGRTIRLLCATYENRIAELKRKLEQTEKDLADYQFNYPTIKVLQKENAELKEKVNILDNCDRLGDMITEAYKDQLTKAIKLLKWWVNHCGYHDSHYAKKTEQFLNEVEK